MFDHCSSPGGNERLMMAVAERGGGSPITVLVFNRIVKSKISVWGTLAVVPGFSGVAQQLDLKLSLAI